MSLSHQNILKVRVTSSPRETILEEIKKYLNTKGAAGQLKKGKGKKPLVITTPNPEQIVLAQSNPEFMEILNRADVALPDGVGLLWASRVLLNRGLAGQSRVIPSRIPGVDFMGDIVSIAAEQGVRIGLIGGFDGLAVRALECLHEKHMKLMGWAVDGPELVSDAVGNIEWPEASYWDTLTEKIRVMDTRVLFVGLGAPKQEYVIDRLRSMVERPIILMSVGGSFEIITGSLRRAPVFMRSIGFEWFWRLIQEPWRWRRQTALIRFVWLVLCAKLVDYVYKKRL